MKKLLFVISFFLLLAPVIVFAHPGNTDALGGHTCWTNCPSWGYSYGEYHYHTPKYSLPLYDYTPIYSEPKETLEVTRRPTVDTTDTSIEVRFDTNIEADSKLDCTSYNPYDWDYTKKYGRTSHRLELTSLESNAEYECKLTITNSDDTLDQIKYNITATTGDSYGASSYSDALYNYLLLQQLGKQSQTNLLNLDITPPTDVINLTAVAGDKKVNLFWTPATDNVGIKNYLITFDSKPIDFSKYSSITDTPNVSYCEQNACYVDGLTNGVIYYFYVLAFDTSNNYSKYWSNNVKAKPLDANPPTRVEKVQVKVTGQTLLLNWSSAKDNEGDVTYKVYWSGYKNKMLPNVTSGAKSKTVKGTSATIKKLAEGKTYYVGIFAVDKSSNESKEAYIYTVRTSSNPRAQELQANVLK